MFTKVALDCICIHHLLGLWRASEWWLPCRDPHLGNSDNTAPKEQKALLQGQLGSFLWQQA